VGTLSAVTAPTAQRTAETTFEQSQPLAQQGAADLVEEWAKTSPHQDLKASNDPNFEGKFWDVIGFYLDPPTNSPASSSITRTEVSHTHLEWLRFLKQIDRESRKDLDTCI
jgi:hypothetical protein